MSKVSVILPVYDENEALLRESIESILAQTFNDIELIIVDDGCSKQTAEILSSYNQSCGSIMLIRNSENIGLTKSLNKALEKASGDLIARMLMIFPTRQESRSKLHIFVSIQMWMSLAPIYT
jgi:glycosyltransferase involved in cell wall biosynthesis